MSRRLILQIVIGLVIVGVLIAGIVIFQAFRTPLAPQMTVVPVIAETLPPIPDATINPITIPETANTQVTETAGVSPTPEPTVIPTDAPGACGGAGAMTILLTAKDAGNFQPPYGADAIRLIKVDYVDETVAVFSVPRNLVVKTGNLENYGYSETRLGDAYQIIMEKESQAADVDIKATSALAQIIFENFGVLPDHYITINGALIKDIIDTLGGIEVDVPSEIKSSTLNLQPGKQRLDGQTTQQFLRYKEDSETSEWNRLPRQDQVIKGIQKKLLSPAVIVRIPELLNQFRYGTTTDLSMQQVVSLTCMMSTVTGDEAAFESINPNSVTIQDDGSMLMVDSEIVKREFLNVFGPQPAP